MGSHRDVQIELWNDLSHIITYTQEMSLAYRKAMKNQEPNVEELTEAVKKSAEHCHYTLEEMLRSFLLPENANDGNTSLEQPPNNNLNMEDKSAPLLSNNSRYGHQTRQEPPPPLSSNNIKRSRRSLSLERRKCAFAASCYVVSPRKSPELSSKSQSPPSPKHRSRRSPRSRSPPSPRYRSRRSPKSRSPPSPRRRRRRTRTPPRSHITKHFPRKLNKSGKHTKSKSKSKSSAQGNANQNQDNQIPDPNIITMPPPPPGYPGPRAYFPPPPRPYQPMFYGQPGFMPRPPGPYFMPHRPRIMPYPPYGNYFPPN